MKYSCIHPVVQGLMAVPVARMGQPWPKCYQLPFDVKRDGTMRRIRGRCAYCGKQIKRAYSETWGTHWTHVRGGMHCGDGFVATSLSEYKRSSHV